MPRAKKTVEDLLAQAVPLERAFARRPDLALDEARVQDLLAAVRKAGGRVAWEIGRITDYLGLDTSYNNPSKAMLLAGSLTKRLADMHIPLKVGSSGRGKYLIFST